MKLRILFLSGLAVVIIFIIYLITLDKKIYYIALGDSLALGQNPYNSTGYGYGDYVSNYLDQKELLDFYTKGFATSGQRVVDLIQDIEENRKIEVNDKSLGLKTALIKADVVTISIGANDLFTRMGINDMTFNLEHKDKAYNYIDEINENLDKLLKIIRIYCKEDIIIVGYYNPLAKLSSHYSRELEPLFLYINEKTKEIANHHHAYFIDIYDIFKENPEYLPNPLDIHPSSAGYEVIATLITSLIEREIIN